MSDTQTKNHFTNVIEEVENAPNNQKADRLITGIAQQMQQSSNQGVTSLQWGQELQAVKSQLVKACSQQQGG